MSKAINFLSSRYRKNLQLAQKDKKFLIIGGIVSGVSLLLCAIVFAISLNVIAQLASIRAAEAEARQQITLSHDAEESLGIFVRKLQKLVQLEKQRKNKAVKIEQVQKLFGSVALLDQISLQSQEGVLKLQLKARDVQAVQEVLRLAHADEVKQQLPSIVLNDLIRDKVGVYTVTISLPL